ncbi:MAG: cytochrome c [Chitinophagaceae bacterium]
MKKAGIILSVIAVIVFAAGCGEGGISPARLESGKKVYAQFCQSCHMENGSGASGMNPALVGSRYAAGDSKKLIEIVLKGSPAFEGDPSREYKNVMPSMAQLDDGQIADVLTYVRNSFGNKASAVAPEDVKGMREKKN